MSRNELSTDDVISVIFTATPDLTAEFPALAARKLGFQEVPLLCASEIGVPGAMPRVVRLMMHIETGQAAVRAAARLPARRGGAAAGHRAVTARPSDAPAGPASVVVIGTGLIGTSVALALREQDIDSLAVPTATPRRCGWPPTSALACCCRPTACPAARPTWPCSPCRRPRSRAELRAAQERVLATLLHRRRQREGAAAGRGPRARLRPGQLRARPPAVRPRAVRPGRGQG